MPGHGAQLPTAEEIARRRAEQPRVRATYEHGTEKVWLANPPRSRRMIEGVASTARDTSLGIRLNSRGALVQFPVPVLSEHGRYEDSRGKARRAGLETAKIGEVIAIAKGGGVIWARAVIDETGFAADAAWRLIEAGETRCLSVSALEECMTPVDGIRQLTGWRLCELSVCRQGANPDCFFIPVSCAPDADLPSLEVLRAWRARQRPQSPPWFTDSAGEPRSREGGPGYLTTALGAGFDRGRRAFRDALRRKT